MRFYHSTEGRSDARSTASSKGSGVSASSSAPRTRIAATSTAYQDRAGDLPELAPEGGNERTKMAK